MVTVGLVEEGELEGGPLAMARRHLDERRTRAGEGRSTVGDQRAAAWEDLDGLSAALKEGRGRRAVPAWSAPKEAWMLALCDAKHLGGREGGEGGGRGGERRCDRLREAVVTVLAATRKKVRPPLAWNVSQAVLLSKKNGKKGPAAKRLIHLLDPLGKAYFKQLWRRKPPRTWHFAAGFTKHRRREQGIVQARVVQYRLTKRGRGFISSSYDVANAFPSISHSELDRVIEDKYGAEPGPDAELLKARCRQAYMHIRTEDGGEILGALGTGGMQGDCVMPGQFVEDTARASKAGHGTRSKKAGRAWWRESRYQDKA